MGSTGVRAAVWPLAFWLAAVGVGCDRASGPTLELVDKSEQVRGLLETRSRENYERGRLQLEEGQRLTLEPMPKERAEVFFPGLGGRKVYDPHCYFFTKPGLRAVVDFAEHSEGRFAVVTNTLGMRENEDPAAKAPDLRILVTGDSHTDGVCSNHESFANRLEAQLAERRPERSVEVLNAGCGSFNFHNYLGLYEKFRSLEPDIFVLCVYGGNDFKGDLKNFAWNRRIVLPRFSSGFSKRQREAVAKYGNAYAQGFQQLAWFSDRPEAAQLALLSARDVLRELALRCAEDDIEFIVAWLPPASDVEWERHAEEFEALTELFKLDQDELRQSDRMADTILAGLAGLERTTVVDLREPLGDGGGPYYWKADKHLNVRGHAATARALLPVVEGLLGGG